MSVSCAPVGWVIQKIWEDELEHWESIQAEFVTNWEINKRRRRVEIHIPSFSFDESQRRNLGAQFNNLQNSQLSRLAFRPPLPA